MRSEIAVKWLREYGLNVERLAGGYKNFRNRIVTQHINIDNYKNEWLIIGGLTGSGKTEFLKSFKESIDLVVTGINFGANLGDDVIYSGTVAGAIEGRFLGLPSIAMSLASWECKHFDTAGNIAKLLVAQIDKSPLAYNTIINVNVPDIPMSEIKGIKSTRLGNRHKSEPSIQDLKNPSLYWIGENGKEADNGEGTDFHAVSNNFVSVTPLQIDLTKYPELKQVSEWLEDIDY